MQYPIGAIIFIFNPWNLMFNSQNLDNITLRVQGYSNLKYTWIILKNNQ